MGARAMRFCFALDGTLVNCVDDDFDSGTRSHPLGDAKAGVSGDLDALAAYVSSLDTYPRSPFRASDGSLKIVVHHSSVPFAA